ncbi:MULTISPECIES: hypothetical protein [Nocardiopsis]|jgi:uncharacterized membrane protein|uniref:Putative membrane protein n=1 Tax=Nocardiopsis sinuspersici TaxID=501010 RepID=A0A7Y9X851_9ACTN|nr:MULTISPECIES: hypothetical protein [Nocardiopsis]NYH50946.1 putative membrane protein [Nocardiopsis sinuspersici]
MDTDLWGILLVVLGGFLAGGAYTVWRANRTIAVALGACAVLAVASGVLRLGYF